MKRAIFAALLASACACRPVDPRFELGPASIRRIEAALGRRLPPGPVSLKETPWRAEERDVRAWALVVDGAEGLKLEVVGYRGEEGAMTLGAVRILEHRLPPDVIADTLLTHRFVGHSARWSAYSPRSRLARTPKVEPLLLQRTYMQHVYDLDVWLSWTLRERDARAVETVDALIETFERVRRAGADLRPYFENAAASVQIWERSVDPPVTHLGLIREAANRADWEGAARLYGTYHAACHACHTPFQMAMVEVRQREGVGDGFFVIGHEFPAPADASLTPAYQSVADAVRKAMLILDQAAPR